MFFIQTVYKRRRIKIFAQSQQVQNKNFKGLKKDLKKTEMETMLV